MSNSNPSEVSPGKLTSSRRRKDPAVVPRQANTSIKEQEQQKGGMALQKSHHEISFKETSKGANEQSSSEHFETPLSGGGRTDEQPCRLSSVGLGKRQLYAVMKKNLTMKRRRPLETVLEILSPMLFVMVVVSFFNISKVVRNEQAIYASRFYDFGRLAEIFRNVLIDFPTKDDDLLDLYYDLDAVLTKEGLRSIPTLDEYIWVHQTLNNTVGQETLDLASDLISRVEGGYWWNLFRLGKIIISPDTPETLQFRQWMNHTYRYWSVVEGRVFGTLEEAADYRDSVTLVEEEDATNRVWAHLHFDSLDFDQNQFECRIRMSHSVLPSTEETIKEFAREPGLSSNMYYWSGFLTLQRAFELFVANRTHSLYSTENAQSLAQNLISIANDYAGPLSYAIGGNKYLTSVILSSGAMDYIDADAIFDLALEVSGFSSMHNLSVEGSHIVDKLRTLPAAPYSYSFADDYSAPFPSLAWEVSEFYSRFGYITGLIMACAVVYPVSQLILVIVQEKEIRMKEMMKIMGLREWVFHASWLITYTTFFLIQALAQAAYLSNTVFGKADFSLILLFIFLFNMTLIALAFIISTFFNRAKLASMLGPLVVFCMVVPAYIFTFYETYQFVAVKKTLSLLAPTAYALGLDRIIAYERNSISLTWENMHEGSMPFSFTLGMLAFDFFLYCFIAWYLDQVLPTKYGSNHQSPFFILKPKFWTQVCSSWVKRLSGSRLEHSQEGSIEDQLKRVRTWNTKQPSVEIKMLTKTYGGVKRKTAVKGITLDMMHGEVTCLLGTNGAGKSTTISMLSGLYETTSGDAYIYGESIVRDITSIRKIMGVCPQHNVLYPDLTVREHLEFFAALKGVTADYLEREVFEMVADCDLMNKIDIQTARLSGGQKRKLSLAISLIGDSKIVFLDEPSAGMDVQSRRSMMNLLLRHKQNRTIILTTHHLEEADLLGDRIAIMKDGVIACHGSPLELKLKYGLGYVMLMTKIDHSQKSVEKLSSYVKQRIKSAQLLTNSAGEVSFQLPSNENRALADLFSDLEPRLKEFNISSYGIAMTSLEDVFLSVAEKAELNAKSNESEPQSSEGHVASKIASSLKGHTAQEKQRSWDVSGGNVSYRAQYWQIVRKRLIALRRDRGSIFHELCMPLIVVTAVLFILSIKPKGAGPPLMLSANSMMHGFVFETPINSQDSTDAIFNQNLGQRPIPDAFEFARVSPNDPESELTSPYFNDDLQLFDHTCQSSICLSWRQLYSQMKLAKKGRFSDVDLKHKRLDMCSYRIGDKAYIPINFGKIAGLSAGDQDSILSWAADELDTTVSEVQSIRVDALLDKKLAQLLETPISLMGFVGAQTTLDMYSWLSNVYNQSIDWNDAVFSGGEAGSDTTGSNNTSSAIETVERWIQNALLALANTGYLKGALVTLDSTSAGGLLIGLAFDKVVPEIFSLFPNIDGGDLSILLSFLPENTTSTGAAIIDDVLDLINEQANLTDYLNTSKTLSEITIEEVLEALNMGSDRYYRARACEVNVTVSDIEAAFGISNMTEAFGLTRDYTNEKNELCSAINDGNIAFTLAVLYVSEFGFPSEGQTWSLANDIFGDIPYIPKSMSFASILSILGDDGSLTLNNLLEQASDFENGLYWLDIPGADGMTLADILRYIGIPLDGESSLISMWLNMNGFATLAGQFTFGTLVGKQDLNLTINIPLSVLYSSTSSHSKPVCINEIAAARIRAQSQDKDASFKVWSQPFETSMKDNVKRVVWLAFFAVLFTLVPFCYNPACYGMHAVQERTSHAKHLMFVSGLGYKTYWLGNLTFDYACYLIVAFWTMFCFAISGAIDFADHRSSVAIGTWCLFLLYGLSAIPQAYCLSFLFSNDSTAQIVISIFNFVTGWMFVVTAVSLDIYSLTETSQMLRKIFRWFPAYNLGEGLIAATEETITRNILEDDSKWNVFEWHYIGRNLFVLFMLSVFYFFLLVVIEWLMGNVRFHKTFSRLRRGLTRLLVGRHSKSSIMPLHVADRADQLREEVANNEPIYEFSDDEEEEALETESKSGSQVSATRDVRLDRLYHGQNSSSTEKATGVKQSDKDELQQFDLVDKNAEEIMEQNESTKVVEGGVLRRMETSGTTGYEFAPNVNNSVKAQRVSRYLFDEDQDVRAERHRVYQHGQNDVLQLRLLRKVFAQAFSGKKFVAVRQLTLGIRPGECFGFLGTNGAGKTTTMRMITREYMPSEGKVLLHGHSIYQYSSSKDIGYCPQFDALFPRLTAREHLEVYANIKGVPKEHVGKLVQKLMEACDLGPFANVLASTYSGGTRRKLSIAIALIGKPDVILLDEPSAGVDPAARRRIWEIIHSSMDSSRSIVLTSHSMEECEALCDRVSIMAGGVMRCIGTSMHLKSRFSSGYEVQIRTETLQDCLTAVGNIQTSLGALVKEQYGPQATLSVPFESSTLSHIFKMLETNRNAWKLTSYGVSQSSLEQVFMNIANKYNTSERPTYHTDASSYASKHQSMRGGGSSGMFSLFTHFSHK